jgi:hypothetical protein
MLVSAGVSVTVTDDSFFIPAAASTVPLIFMATASEKLQPNGDPALGTYEYNQVRTITSAEQSVRTYGTPIFKTDVDGNPQHGDARNEYGLFALNQYLGIGNRAFVVRANVNLNDDRDDVLDLWFDKIQQNVSPLGAAYILESRTVAFLNEYNATNGLIPSDPGYKTTVTSAELNNLIVDALDEVFGTTSNGIDLFFEEATFKYTRPDFVEDQTALPLKVFANGYDQPTTGDYLGLDGARAKWVTDGAGGVVAGEWSSLEARNFLIAQSELFQYTVEFANKTSLGANDASRRAEIVGALAEAINSNTEIRSERYEYNLILCPGYYEVADEMVALAVELNEEAFVVADTPMNMNPEEVVAWAATPDRQSSTNVAYYYPHSLASNLDGNEVLAAASGTALRTITYSDEVSELWFAPAGTRRGLVSGVSRVGYYTGTAGTATTFVEANLNQGQRDDLYKYFTNINPIVFFPNRGIIVWGQKTAAPAASALDRINVARLIGYVKRQLRKNTMPFLFEPNDQLTRDSLKAAVDGFLGDIVIKRGFFDFATVCDTTNNTPDRIDRNEMYIDVALKPTKAAEFLYIPIRIVSTGEDI